MEKKSKGDGGGGSGSGDDRDDVVDTEDEVGDYNIEIRVILRFGVELASVAGQVQQRIAEQVEKMTSKSTSRVNVIIDGVRTQEEADAAAENDWEGQPHTD